MKASQFYISTLKEAPADAEIASHQLMTRAGMIKKLGAGIYSYMPMGLRVIRKVEAIVRDEMNKAGAIEMTMPIIQPAELWQETDRFTTNGPELLRIQDRHGRDFIVQPTSEEVATDVMRQDIKSYKQLPKNIYQIQTKFRDERRPRFGLMRGREFIMKDAYSFDRDEAAAKVSYQNMAAAYRKIFDRFGLSYRAVAADSGAIGGDLSEEFQVIAATGEDAIVYCPTSDYAANMEKAEALAPQGERKAATQVMTKTATPGKSTCADVAEFLGIPLQSTVKSLVLATDTLNDKNEVIKTQVWLLLLRGDHDMNEVKVGKIEGLAGFRFATVPEIEEHFGCKPGYLGPIPIASQKPKQLVRTGLINSGKTSTTRPELAAGMGLINSAVVNSEQTKRETRAGLINSAAASATSVELVAKKGLINSLVFSSEQPEQAVKVGLINYGKTSQPLKILVDREVAVMADWVCGANEPDFHITGVNWGRDLPEPDLVADLRNVVSGDASPDGKGVLAIERGIEVGHVFYLGTKYSKAMNATFLGDNGKPQFLEMGCYGIGITRLPAAAIEQNHDDKGIIWPDAIAPFTVVLCPISPDRFADVKAASDTLYAELIAAGVDVILDDRNERPGAMFADWELIGVPHRVTIGDRGLKEGHVEYQHRRDTESTKIQTADALTFIKGKLGL